jgi:hypothetical protein
MHRRLIAVAFRLLRFDPDPSADIVKDSGPGSQLRKARRTAFKTNQERLITFKGAPAGKLAVKNNESRYRENDY